MTIIKRRYTIKIQELTAWYRLSRSIPDNYEGKKIHAKGKKDYEKEKGYIKGHETLGISSGLHCNFDASLPADVIDVVR